MNHCPIELDARKAIPKAWKQAALARSGGTCIRLGCAATEALEYDHAIPLALGGKHRADNIQPLCRAHHRLKTDNDLKLIAKAKRLSGETGQRARRERRGGGSIPARVDPWPPKGSVKLPPRPFQQSRGGGG